MYYCDGEEDILPQPDCVCDGVFISDYETTESIETLKKHKITHVLNLVGGRELFPQDFTYMILDNIVDIAHQDLLSYFPQCLRFMEEGIKAGGVLVHCAAGISRSATIICAFLMYKDNIMLDQALAKLRKVRPCVNPNHGFKQQLEWWHQMSFNLEGNTKAHRMYKLHKMATEFEMTRQVPTTIYVAPDPHTQENPSNEEIYGCSNCRRKLFTDSHVVEHQQDTVLSSMRSYMDKLPCESFFIEPMAWMTNLLQTQKTQNFNSGAGDIRCPNRHCSNVLGSYNFSTIRCNCQSTVRPAFSIKRHKVQKLEPTNFTIAQLIRSPPVVPTSDKPGQRTSLQTIVN